MGTMSIPEAQFQNKGFYFQWHFLEACNLRCRHCYQDGYVANITDKALIDSVITQMGKALSAWKISGRVSITGGEPLTDLDTLYYILERLEEVAPVEHVGILTNGTLLDDEVVKRLTKYKKLHGFFL